MKPNKKVLMVFLALFYLVVIQKIVTLYLFPSTGINTPLSQLQQDILPYAMIIKIVLLLIALSIVFVYVVLKEKLGTDDLPIPEELFVTLMLVFSAIIPIAALLNTFLTGYLLFSSILVIYGLVITIIIYTRKLE